MTDHYINNQPVTVIVPAYNEESSIAACVTSLQAAFGAEDLTVLVVDNGSTDATAQRALQAGAQVITEQEKGKGNAVARGVAQALARNAQWIVLHDADNEYCAEDVARLLERCRLAQFASFARTHVRPALMGIGCRQVELGRVLWRSVIANWIARSALKLRQGAAIPPDILTGARIFNAGAARVLYSGQHPQLKGFELETGLTRLACAQQLELVCAPVRYTPRPAGEKKIRARDLLPILWHALRASP